MIVCFSLSLSFPFFLSRLASCVFSRLSPQTAKRLFARRTSSSRVTLQAVRLRTNPAPHVHFFLSFRCSFVLRLSLFPPSLPLPLTAFCSKTKQMTSSLADSRGGDSESKYSHRSFSLWSHARDCRSSPAARRLPVASCLSSRSSSLAVLLLWKILSFPPRLSADSFARQFDAVNCPLQTHWRSVAPLMHADREEDRRRVLHQRSRMRIQAAKSIFPFSLSLA